jgi:hypothetical protein
LFLYICVKVFKTIFWIELGIEITIISMIFNQHFEAFSVQLICSRNSAWKSKRIKFITSFLCFTIIFCKRQFNFKLLNLFSDKLVYSKKILRCIVIFFELFQLNFINILIKILLPTHYFDITKMFWIEFLIWCFKSYLISLWTWIFKKKIKFECVYWPFQPFKLDKVVNIQRKLIVDLFRRSIFF